MPNSLPARISLCLSLLSSIKRNNISFKTGLLGVVLFRKLIIELFLIVEEWCDITFEGNINDFYEVSDFLADYLDTAKEIAEDAAASYWSMLNGY